MMSLSVSTFPPRVYPLGTSDVTDFKTPVALGMRSPQQTVVAVWRIDGPAITKISLASREAKTPLSQ
jgi:hypothetical protein